MASPTSLFDQLDEISDIRHRMRERGGEREGGRQRGRGAGRQRERGREAGREGGTERCNVINRMVWTGCPTFCCFVDQKHHTYTREEKDSCIGSVVTKLNPLFLK